MSKAEEILKDNGLRITEPRLEVLESFLSFTSAVSQGDIEDSFDLNLDRVTVYRTIKTFLERGIIHKVLDDNGTSKYALCKEQCHDGHHHDHLHFKCSVCQQTQCLEKLFIPKIVLPQDYQMEEVNILVQGVCPNCR